MKRNIPFFKKDKHSFETILWFGMYKGYKIQEVWEVNSQYLRWLLKNTEMLVLKKSDEDRIYDRASLEDEQRANYRSERRARRFFGGAGRISGQDPSLYSPFEDPYDYGVDQWDIMD